MYVGRYAPSPTGDLHLGNARTALIAWLWARRAGGRCLLRFEDLDAARVRPGCAQAQAASLAWLGLDWDGDPVAQSRARRALRRGARRAAGARRPLRVLLLARRRAARRLRAARPRRPALLGRLPQPHGGRARGPRRGRARARAARAHGGRGRVPRRRAWGRSASCSRRRRATSWCAGATASSPTSWRSSSTTRSRASAHVVRGADLLALDGAPDPALRAARARAGAGLRARPADARRRRRAPGQAPRSGGPDGAARGRRGSACDRRAGWPSAPGCSRRPSPARRRS